MMQSFRIGVLAAMLAFSAGIFAGELQVEGAWARATLPGQDAGMADMTLTAAQDAVLTGASSPACNSIELHTMTHEGGMMKMREVKEIALPAGKRVNLGKSGYHLMLIGLKAPLKAGDSVPLTLKVKLADSRTVEMAASAETKPLTAPKPAAADEAHDHHHHH